MIAVPSGEGFYMLEGILVACLLSCAISHLGRKSDPSDMREALRYPRPRSTDLVTSKDLELRVGPDRAVAD